jgi:hypothetical protein
MMVTSVSAYEKYKEPDMKQVVLESIFIDSTIYLI